MGPFAGRSSIAVSGPVALALALLCSGCRTAPGSALFSAAGPGWRIQEGQVLWRPSTSMTELGGEVVVATHEDGRSSIQFSKTPLPLVLAQVTPTNWLIRFPARRLGFTGPKPAPARFAWLYVSDALKGRALPAGYTFQRQADGGWRLENIRSGETIQGYLSP